MFERDEGVGWMCVGASTCFFNVDMGASHKTPNHHKSFPALVFVECKREGLHVQTQCMFSLNCKCLLILLAKHLAQSIWKKGNAKHKGLKFSDGQWAKATTLFLIAHCCCVGVIGRGSECCSLVHIFDKIIVELGAKVLKRLLDVVFVEKYCGQPEVRPSPRILLEGEILTIHEPQKFKTFVKKVGSPIRNEESGSGGGNSMS